MITCTRCNQANRDSAFFCKHCGERLACPRCFTLLPLESRFCDNCGQWLALIPSGEPDLQGAPLQARSSVRTPTPRGEQGRGSPSEGLPPSTESQPALARFLPQELQAKLEAARAGGGMVGERRVVTMMFCDVLESTRAAENLDPEVWTEIINGAFEHMIRPVYKYEGTVARLMGDSILAFFGAPITHEDDPQRAVLAGLEIVDGLKPYQESVRKAHGIQVDVRVGINTGPVVVGAVGSDLRMEYSAMGDAINVAARMEQTASPGTIQVAQDTYRLVSPLFEFEDLGTLEVKGRTAPVQAYRVLERKAAPGRMRGIEGLDAPMIGRAAEERLLKDAAQSLEKGVGSIVFLVGEAGLGKSRLIRELHQGIGGVNGVSLQWYETASLSYESAQPYSLFQRLVRRAADLRAADPPDVVREKLAGLAGTSPGTSQEQTVRVLESLYGLPGLDGRPPLEGESFKGQLYVVAQDFLRRMAATTPVILVCDDLHWTDTASSQLLEHLYPLSEEVPILFLCALRPERESGGWDLFQRTENRLPHRVTVIDILPLTPDDSSLLIDSLLTISDLPVPLRQIVLSKAEGNPFFVEEVVRTLIETEVVRRDESGMHWVASGDGSEIDIPNSLQTLLITRIDRLDEETRRVLQLASLIGRSFYFRILDQVMLNLIAGPESHENSGNPRLRQRLTQLQHADLIREAARIPELEYIFRHALTQEAAYGTILHKLRKEYHLVVGEAIEALFAEELEPHAAALARHFDEGGDLEKAARYYTMAGDQTFRMYGLAETITLYTQALSLIDRHTADSRQLLHIYAQRGRALELNADYSGALENYDEMARLADERHDEALYLGSLQARSIIHSTFTPVFDARLGLPLAEEAIQLARKLGDHRAEARVLWSLLLVHNFALGETEKGVVYGQEGLKLARDHDLKDVLPFLLNDFGRTRGFQGHLEEGLRSVREAQALFEEAGNMAMLQDSHSSEALQEFFAGNPEASIRAGDEGLRVSRSIGNQWGITVNSWYRVMALTELGELGTAVRIFEDAGMHANLGQRVAIMSFIGMLYSDLGRVEEALDEYDSIARQGAASIAFARKGFVGQQARLSVLTGQYEKAEELLEPFPLNPESSSFVITDIVICLSAAELEIARGSPAKAVDLLERTRRRVEDLGVFWLLGDLYLTQARAVLEADPDEVDRARELLERAIGLTRERGYKRVLWKLLLALSDLVEPDDARSLRREAGDIVRWMASGIEDPVKRKLFLDQPLVNSLLERNQEA